ncbi:hypothetical protein ACH4SP_19605 [Streptomyces sp. NPDC021093]|uniref:hypothetical protein n=1 Tax=Streptomyces sp. NPDC021093 TaxID=3365112 RepID=UPI0037999D15
MGRFDVGAGTGGEQGGSSVSDEEWERFLQDSVNGAPDAPKEPSARARMVTRRLREEPANPTQWRAHSPTRPRRIKAWHVIALLAALALLAVALIPGTTAGWFGGGGTDQQPLAAESARPSEAPPGGPDGRGTLDEPFRGSPAARWADGTAGITVPAARATGWMSTDQVAQALGRTRDFLAASNLDPHVLRGEHPTRASALVNPEQHDVQDFLRSAFRTPSKENDPLLLFSRFDQARARLVGDVVKTRGRITYREGERGALRVSTDVTYVYPVVRAAAGSTEVVRTIVRREVVLSWDDPAKVRTAPGTFSLVSYKVDMTNGGCDPNTAYFRPEFGSTAADGGSEVDPYDRSKPVAEGSGEGCASATRS